MDEVVLQLKQSDRNSAEGRRGSFLLEVRVGLLSSAGERTLDAVVRRSSIGREEGKRGTEGREGTDLASLRDIGGASVMKEAI